MANDIRLHIYTLYGIVAVMFCLQLATLFWLVVISINNHRDDIIKKLKIR